MAGCRARKVPVQAGGAGENRCESRCGPRAARGGARSWLDRPGPSTPPASASFAGSGSSEFVPVSAPSLLQPLRAYAVISWGWAVAHTTPWASYNARSAPVRLAPPARRNPSRVGRSEPLCERLSLLQHPQGVRCHNLGLGGRPRDALGSPARPTRALSRGTASAWRLAGDCLPEAQLARQKLESIPFTVDSESTKQLFRSWNNSGTGTPWNVSGKLPTPSVGAAAPCNVAASRPGGSLRVALARARPPVPGPRDTEQH